MRFKVGAAARFKQSNIPRQQGELARLKVVQGPDLGLVYVIMGNRVTLGRGEENDVVITDLKASRIHAELLSSSTGWSVRDLGSANGIAHNGKNVREAKIQVRDTISLGGTTLEFLTSESPTTMLVAPPPSMEEVRKKQSMVNVHKQKIMVFGSSLKESGKFKNPKVLIALGIGAVFLLLLDGEQQKPAKRKKTDAQQGRDLASFLPSADISGVSSRSAEMFFKAGFREYRTGNYLRAKVQFETALQVLPAHHLSRLYLENCHKRIAEEVKFHLEVGRKSMESGKLRDARGHFEAVLRFLHKDQSNPAFTEAKDQLEKVVKEQKGATS